MDREQRKHLEQRIAMARNAKKRNEHGYRDRYRGAPPDIVHHLKLQRLHERAVDRWLKKRNKIIQAHNLRVDNAAYKLREVLLFGDSMKALKAVQAFERQVFK